MGLDEAGVNYELGKGIVVNDLSQSISNKDVFGVDMSGKMAKVVVQNSLFDDDWKFKQPCCTRSWHATVGLFAEDAASKASLVDVNVYRTSLEHNDHAITESDT